MKQHWNTRVITDLITRNFLYGIEVVPFTGENSTEMIYISEAPSKYADFIAVIFGVNTVNNIPYDIEDDVDVDRIHCTACATHGMKYATSEQTRMVAGLTEMLRGAGYIVTNDGSS